MKRVYAGLTMLTIGLVTADSRIIILPAIIAIAGALLMVIGSREFEEGDE